MARSTRIHKFRDYNKHAVINQFTYHNAGKAHAGEFVKVQTGWQVGQDLEQHNHGKAFNNTVSPRWALKATVTTANTGDTSIGMLLSDMREKDENDRYFIDRPTKQWENHIVLSGEAIPIVTEGLFRYSGSDLPSVSANDAAYISGGQLTNDKVFGDHQKVGTFLGPKDGFGYALLKLDVN